MTGGAFRWPRLIAWGFALGLSVLAPALAAPDAPVIFRRGNDAEPETLDPHHLSSHWENTILGDLFLGLTTEDAAARPIPGAAESWTTSPDGLVWTFTLRPGLLWSDGVPLKASDFLFGFRRLLDPKTAARYAFIQYVIKNAEKVNAGKLPLDEVGIRVVDDRTLEISLETPTPFLPGLLTHATAYPIPEHLYRRHGDAWVKPGIMVTNGAYIVTEWVPHDRIVAKKNPRFYDAANVAIDIVEYYPVEKSATSLARYRAGELDASLGRAAFGADDIPLVGRLLPGQAHLVPQLTSEYLVANMQRPPFSDARLRRALSLCLDRRLLAEKVYKDGTVAAEGFVPPRTDNYHNVARFDFAGWSMDKRREEARRLLAEAGYGPDKPLVFEYRTMSTTNGRRSSVTEAAMLKDCNMTAQILFMEPKVYYAALQQGDFTLGFAAWGADYNDPYTFLYLLDSRAGAYNYQGYNNPTYDRLLDKAQQTLDLEARAAVLAEAEQIALNDTATIPMIFPAFRTLVAPYVKGYVENPVTTHRTRWMSLDKPPA